MFFNIHCDFDFDRSANARSFEFIFCVNAQKISYHAKLDVILYIRRGEGRIRKIRNAQCFSCLCVQPRKNAIVKLAPRTFSFMNVLFIKIKKIFVGIKFRPRRGKMFDDFSSKSGGLIISFPLN